MDIDKVLIQRADFNKKTHKFSHILRTLRPIFMKLGKADTSTLALPLEKKILKTMNNEGCGREQKFEFCFDCRVRIFSSIWLKIA